MDLCGVCRPNSTINNVTDRRVSQSRSYVNFKIANALIAFGFIDRPVSRDSISDGCRLSNPNKPNSSINNAARLPRVRRVKRKSKIADSIHINGVCETVSDPCLSSISIPTGNTGLTVSPDDIKCLRAFRAKVMKRRIELKKRLL